MKFLILLFALCGCALAQFGQFNNYRRVGAFAPTPRPVAYTTQQPLQYNQQQYQGDYRSNRPAIQIRSEHKDTSPDGSYNFSYESENGIVVQESGAPRAPGPEGPAEVVSGSYSYTSPEGQQITVNYVADENGFRATGDHLPTPPPIPPEILRSLEANAANPQNEDYPDSQYNNRQYNRPLPVQNYNNRPFNFNRKPF